jgi:hypothetical protein
MNGSQQSRPLSHLEFDSASKCLFNARSVDNKQPCLSIRPRDDRFIAAPASWQHETGKVPAKLVPCRNPKLFSEFLDSLRTPHMQMTNAVL